MSTTNDLVIRMRCGNRDAVGRKWGNWKRLREGWGLEKIVEICRRVKTVPLKPEGTAPGPTIWSLNCACFTPFPGIHFSGYGVYRDLRQLADKVCPNRSSFRRMQRPVCGDCLRAMNWFAPYGPVKYGLA